ncbi:tRNA (guanine(10)-N(2))-dimethyltransferase [Candidatus Bathyarchaeota archaeon]|nr:MAG: tRNA (guanine(10)-N(2))-dimethyltransferase [Candidatus Bathyarchaeota archaeon]
MKSKVKIDFPTETVTEGKVKILVPKLKAFIKSPSEYAPSKAPVFYNPCMELNRDFAVLALQAYQKMVNREIFICEPLAGCGVRGIRFAVEVEGVKEVLVNDINEKASQLAMLNVKTNRLNKRVIVKNEDANFLLATYGAPHKRFDAIDIDPFGSPAPYADSALRALRDDGFLALTATDMAPLCGVYPKACVRRYYGKPLRTEYCHELAVRLLAGFLALTAAKYNIGVELLFSHSTDHYIRVYAKIAYGAKKADESLKKMGYIAHCFSCFHRETMKGLFPSILPSKCSECDAKLSISGPLWLGKLVDKKFCELMENELHKKRLGQREKIEKILTLVKGEADAPPTYYVIDKFCDALNLPVPPLKAVLEGLREENFQAFLTHFNSKGVKSNAPAAKLKEVLCEALRLSGKF